MAIQVLINVEGVGKISVSLVKSSNGLVIKLRTSDKLNGTAETILIMTDTCRYEKIRHSLTYQRENWSRLLSLAYKSGESGHTRTTVSQKSSRPHCTIVYNGKGKLARVANCIAEKLS